MSHIPKKKSVKRKAVKTGDSGYHPHLHAVHQHDESRPEFRRRALSALAYLGFLGVTGLILIIWIPVMLYIIFRKKDDDFMHFHARQAFVLFVVNLIFVFVIAFVVKAWGLLGVSLGVFGKLFAVIPGIITVMLLVFWIVSIIQCLLGNAWKIPYLGDWAEHLKF